MLNQVAPNDADAQLIELGRLLASRIDDLAQSVTESVRTGVAFYRDNPVVTDADLLENASEHLTLVFQALQNNSTFDTNPASATGHGPGGDATAP